MFIYDLTLLGSDFNTTGAKLDRQAQMANVVVAGTVLETVVRLFNTHNLSERDAIIDELTMTCGDLVFPLDLGGYVNNLLSFIEAKANEWCWDPNIKVKLIRTEINQYQKRAMIKMDLEATCAAMMFTPQDTRYIEDDIIDNPSAEEMEMLDDKCPNSPK